MFMINRKLGESCIIGNQLLVTIQQLLEVKRPGRIDRGAQVLAETHSRQLRCWLYSGDQMIFNGGVIRVALGRINFPKVGVIIDAPGLEITWCVLLASASQCLSAAIDCDPLSSVVVNRLGSRTSNTHRSFTSPNL